MAKESTAKVFAEMKPLSPINDGDRDFYGLQVLQSPSANISSITRGNENDCTNLRQFDFPFYFNNMLKFYFSFSLFQTNVTTNCLKERINNDNIEVFQDCDG